MLLFVFKHDTCVISKVCNHVFLDYTLQHCFKTSIY